MRHDHYWSSSSASTCRLCFSFLPLSFLSYINPVPPPLSHTSCMPSGNLMGRAATRWSDSLSRCNPLMLNRCYFIVGSALFSSAVEKKKAPVKPQLHPAHWQRSEVKRASGMTCRRTFTRQNHQSLITPSIREQQIPD